MPKIRYYVEVKKPKLKLFNTQTQRLEVFTPITQDLVKMYNCGPTVGGVQHIGNLLPPVYTNVLRRTLESWGYNVQQVTNITDFGHLTSDADDGEDKMTLALLREGLPLTLESMSAVAEKFADTYFQDVKKLGITLEAVKYPRASAYIPQQIAIVTSLQEKGFAYETKDGVYFETSLLLSYGKLGGLVLDEEQAETRIHRKTEKHCLNDFALWKKSSDRLGWDSPWGMGFPGWHTECVAMIFALLGKEIDIHTGGIEHVAIHHNNEIAQAETYSGKVLSRYWLHNNHITIDGKKISKSIGNTVYLSDILKRSIDPMSLRYWFLTGHYRTPMNFTWEALEGADTARTRLARFFTQLPELETDYSETAYKEFVADIDLHLSNDISTAQALARVWELVKSRQVSESTKRASILYADNILNIGLTHMPSDTLPHRPLAASHIPDKIAELVLQRLKAREEKNFKLADALRKEAEQHGFTIKDTLEGSEVFVKSLI